jgi:hypothetical protein
MNNKLYFLSKFLNRNNNLFIIFIAVFIAGANLCMLSERYLLGISLFLLIAIFSLFKSFISEIKLDKNEVDIPLNGENIIIKKTFFYDGHFKTFINTTDPSRKPHFYTIKEGEEWTIFSIVEDKDDWMLFMKDDNNIQISIRYFESKKYWETKSDIRDNRLKQLGI